MGGAIVGFIRVCGGYRKTGAEDPLRLGKPGVRERQRTGSAGYNDIAPITRDVEPPANVEDPTEPKKKREDRCPLKEREKKCKPPTPEKKGKTREETSARLNLPPKTKHEVLHPSPVPEAEYKRNVRDLKLRLNFLHTRAWEWT